MLLLPRVLENRMVHHTPYKLNFFLKKGKGSMMLMIPRDIIFWHTSERYLFFQLFLPFQNKPYTLDIDIEGVLQVLSTQQGKKKR